MGRSLGPAFYAILAGVLAGGFRAHAQPQFPTAIPQTKFNSGQDVVPSFDGWLKNSDGTFTFVFGYMNRNYKEELAIPAGPDNKVEPGTALDQGQPTYFLPRRHAWVFQVRVPADWGQKELVWTITAHGRTEKAYASLQMVEQIAPRLIMSHGNLSPGLDDPNKPPSVSIAPVSSASAGSPVSLTALVSDDGLPKPRVLKARTEVGPGKAQTNSAGQGRRMPGVSLSWFQYRGPAKVTFEPADPVRLGTPGEPLVNGKAVTAARFTQPGTYVLRATADDGALSGTSDVTITVTR
ncbi:MAG TPA: hypothetical protein VEV17_20895 [Bryobacteraceae bacterium]|nr:hypothetical protein [Bryobacteraceae bacterium]